MDAIKLLKSQHEEVADLFGEYEEAESGAPRRAIFNKIADALAAHSTIEERIFYPNVYIGELKSQLKEAVEEHLSVKRVIADLLDLSTADANFDAKVKVLQEQVEHHVEEEQAELFPKVRATLSKRELDAMGETMEQMFDALMEGSPRNDVREQIDHAAPLS